MVDATLRQLDVWYNEPSEGSDRPKLLSKLAVLELCGWLEGEFDRLVLEAQNSRLNDVPWVESNVLKWTNGFSYSDHLRPMLAKLVGEIFVRRIETEMESQHPGELERMKSSLGHLWKKRCDFAHADMTANVAAQQSFDAPSWSINQHRILKKIIDHYKVCVLAVLSAI